MTRAGFVILAVALGAVRASAQTPADPPAFQFIPRAIFYMSAEMLNGEADERYRWDTNFGGELDVIDYRAGRFTFAANYQAVLGDELRRFDPNQGNYILEGAASVRTPAAEIAGVFYHQSRHLSDRPKIVPVDWNMLGVRASRAFIAGATHVDARVDVRGVVQHSYVDYRWEFDGGVRADHILRPGVGILAAGFVRHMGVDGTRNRGNQTGGRVEGGLRLEGGAGAMEFFAAVERRIDPYPLEFGTATWAGFGFRLLTH